MRLFYHSCDTTAYDVLESDLLSFEQVSIVTCYLQAAELLMCEFARIAGGLMRLGHVNMNT